DFIVQFGQRAFRRPLSSSEAALARRVYDEVRPHQDATSAFAALVQYFVQAPQLLYRVERGGRTLGPGLVQLTDWEMASRLSYFFLDSMPDAELLAAAAEGRLSAPEQVEAQARRLI